MNDIFRKTYRAALPLAVREGLYVFRQRALALGPNTFRAITVGGWVTARDNQTYHVPRSIHPHDLQALLSGSYEADEIGILREHFQPENGVIIEIGGHIGISASHGFAEKLKDGGKYVVVEPNRKVLRSLEANMEHVQRKFPGRHFEIVRAAIVGENGREANFIPKNNMSSGLAEQIKSSGREKTVRVQTVTLSELIQRYSPREQISLICDAEGAEINMVERDPDAFKRIRQISIELHEPSLTNRPDVPIGVMQNRLENLGFLTRASAGNTFYMSRDI